MRIIGDLYDYEGSIKTWSVLSAECHLGPESFLSCYSLVKAIPKEWKAILRSSIVIDGNLASENANNELYRHLSAKFVCKKLISNCFVHPTSQVHLLTKFYFIYQISGMSIGRQYTCLPDFVQLKTTQEFFSIKFSIISFT